MTPLLVRADDAPPQPWRNGLGRTRELLARPAPADWWVRVSVADIERDAPFSAFPGVERWFAVLKGAGVELHVGEAVHRLVRGDAPLRFDGAQPARCRLLDGPTRDLNLMLRGAWGGMVVVDDELPWRPHAAMCGLFSAVSGRCTWRDDDGAVLDAADVPPYALLWFDGAPPQLEFRAAERPAAVAGWWLSASPGSAPALASAAAAADPRTP